jgi:hypothetical protein
VAALPQVLRQLHARGYRPSHSPPVQLRRPNGWASKRQAGPIPAARVENVVL